MGDDYRERQFRGHVLGAHARVGAQGLQEDGVDRGAGPGELAQWIMVVTAAFGESFTAC